MSDVELKRYSVVVDYTTTATITVDAVDEEGARKVVLEYADTEDGKRDLLARLMNTDNMPHGMEVACVEEAEMPPADLTQRVGAVDCQHDWVGDGVVLTSIPPQRRWVCSKCGETTSTSFYETQPKTAGCRG